MHLILGMTSHKKGIYADAWLHRIFQMRADYNIYYVQPNPLGKLFPVIDKFDLPNEIKLLIHEFWLQDAIGELNDEYFKLWRCTRELNERLAYLSLYYVSRDLSNRWLPVKSFVTWLEQKFLL